MRIDEFEFRNKQGEEIEPTKAQLVIYIKGLHRQIKKQKNTIKSRNNKLKNKNKEIEKLKYELEQKNDAFSCLQYTCARDITRANNELLQVKYQKDNLEYNWNALCDYLGECIIKYEEVDENGIYREILDVVNKIKNYNPNPQIQKDKIRFAIKELTIIRDRVRECNSLDEIEGKVRLDIAKLIRLKIEELKNAEQSYFSQKGETNGNN